MRMSVTTTWGVLDRSRDQLVVVGTDPHDAEVVGAVQERPHPFADQEVVVGEHDADRHRKILA